MNYEKGTDLFFSPSGTSSAPVLDANAQFSLNLVCKTLCAGCPQLNAEGILEPKEVCQVALKVFLDGENHLPVVIPLRDVMSDSGYNNL